MYFSSEFISLSETFISTILMLVPKKVIKNEWINETNKAILFQKRFSLKNVFILHLSKKHDAFSAQQKRFYISKVKNYHNIYEVNSRNDYYIQFNEKKHFVF